MHNPYFINGPALLSVSDGRTSAYMLFKILEAHDGKLPADVHAAFANTGLEMPETYEFMREISRRWGVPITWLEWRDDPECKFAVVGENSFASAGEPFKALVKKRQYLPNPTQRICTYELKVKTMRRWMKSMYPKSKKSDGWNNVVGLRADEMHRVFSLHNTKFELGQSDATTPLADDKVTRFDVKDFWDNQEFDLNLSNANGVTPSGNCTLCFLKGLPTLMGLIRQDPSLADHWIEMEESQLNAKGDCGYFRNDRPSYRKMVELVERQPDIFINMPDEPTIPCGCTD